MSNVPPRENAGKTRTIREVIESGELPRGLDTPILGVLPITADGCVVGTNAEVFAVNGERCSLFVRGQAWGEVKTITDTGERVRDEWPIEKCYSTREAAESARGRWET